VAQHGVLEREVVGVGRGGGAARLEQQPRAGSGPQRDVAVDLTRQRLGRGDVERPVLGDDGHELVELRVARHGS
jgi:hypothetical protein